MDIQNIDTQEKLLAFCESLAGSDWIALDTEFMRESTYYPKLCLLQVGTPDITGCIDPLAIRDLDPILDVIFDPSITKVVHAGSQDLEILYHLRGSVPAPMFDTQVAAPLLGFPEQAGYARLVEDILGKRLDKIHTRADWSHRPLTEAQLTYAAEDVIYLCKIYTHLRDELTRRNRLDWLSDDFAALSDSARYENPPEQAWRRIKAAYKLRKPELAILQSLAAWREQAAQSQNKPRGWLMKDDVLMDIARQKPGTLDELSRIRGLHEHTAKRHGLLILDMIEQAKGKTPEPLPDYVKAEKPDAAQEAVVDMLNAIVHVRAAEQDLNPALLAPHKQLQQLVLGTREMEILQGWRKKLIGTELVAALEGNRVLRIVEGRLVIQESGE